MRASLLHSRSGLTLLELLVVLVILAITSAIVPLAWRNSRATQTRALDDLIHTARREAIRRGDELRLRVDGDGAWVLAARDGSDILQSGRIAAPAAAVSLRVDALGTCRPSGDRLHSDRSNSDASFDMLTCHYVAPHDVAPAVAP